MAKLQTFLAILTVYKVLAKNFQPPLTLFAIGRSLIVTNGQILNNLVNNVNITAKC